MLAVIAPFIGSFTRNNSHQYEIYSLQRALFLWFYRNIKTENRFQKHHTNEYKTLKVKHCLSIEQNCWCTSVLKYVTLKSILWSNFSGMVFHPKNYRTQNLEHNREFILTHPLRASCSRHFLRIFWIWFVAVLFNIHCTFLTFGAHIFAFNFVRSLTFKMVYVSAICQRHLVYSRVLLYFHWMKQSEYALPKKHNLIHKNKQLQSAATHIARMGFMVFWKCLIFASAWFGNAPFHSVSIVIFCCCHCCCSL